MKVFFYKLPVAELKLIAYSDVSFLLTHLLFNKPRIFFIP